MRVRMVQSFAEGYQAHAAGDELEVSDQYGLTLLQRGLAERLDTVPETAAMPNRGERAVRHARAAR